MSKPSWDDAPKWASYLAMDGDGLWVWYQTKPDWCEEINEWEELSCGYRAEYVDGTPDCDGIDWDQAFDTLEARP